MDSLLFLHTPCRGCLLGYPCGEVASAPLKGEPRVLRTGERREAKSLPYWSGGSQSGCAAFP